MITIKQSDVFTALARTEKRNKDEYEVMRKLCDRHIDKVFDLGVRIDECEVTKEEYMIIEKHLVPDIDELLSYIYDQLRD